MVRAAIKQKEIDERVELKDEEILEIISKQLKEKKNAIKDFKKKGGNDRI